MNKQKQLEQFLIDIYINDDTISGIFISGSLADGSYDQYSDVDIRYIINKNDDELIIKYKNDFREQIKSWQNQVLFYEPCYFSNALIPHFDNFIKADVFFYTTNKLTPSKWLKNIKIIKDKDDTLSKLKADSHNMQHIPSVDTINNEILKFYACSHECFRRIKRNEFLYADYLLDSMKFTIINFLDYINENDNIGWKNAEKRFSKELIKTLNVKIIKEDEALHNLININNLFFEAEIELCKKYNIQRNFSYDYFILTYYGGIK